jgi:hypothetical protein
VSLARFLMSLDLFGAFNENHKEVILEAILVE